MNCPKCGAENINGSSFCVKCGANLKELQSNDSINNSSINGPAIQPTFNEPLNQPIQQPMNNQQYMGQPIQQPINNQQYMEQTANIVSTAPLNYFLYMANAVLKPVNNFKKEEAKFNNPKTSFILALLVSVLMIIVNTVKTIFTAVRTVSYTYYNSKTVWNWDNIKDIKWLDVIGKNLLIYVGIILAITIVFYFGGLVVKKQLSFVKSLAISATSMIPAVVGMMILAPLCGLVWDKLNMVLTIFGLVYSIVVLYELIDNQLNLKGDQRVYFNLVCFGILAIAGYYVYVQVFVSSITSGMENILDFFN